MFYLKKIKKFLSRVNSYFFSVGLLFRKNMYYFDRIFFLNLKLNIFSNFVNMF